MSEANSNSQIGSQELAAISTTEPLSDESRVARITEEILQHKKQVICSFIQIGKLLDEARGRLKKEGLWLKWLETEVDISARMAQRYIQLARAFPDATSVSHLGMTKTLALLALPEGQRETFLNELHKINGEQKKVEDMSVREIRAAIREQTAPFEPAEDVTESAGAIDEADTASQEQSSGSAGVNNYPSPLKPITSDHKTSVTKMQSKAEYVPVNIESIVLDIESANKRVDGILEVLESQAAGVVHGEIANNLCSLLEKVQRCLDLANLKVPPVN